MGAAAGPRLSARQVSPDSSPITQKRPSTPKDGGRARSKQVRGPPAGPSPSASRLEPFATVSQTIQSKTPEPPAGHWPASSRLKRMLRTGVAAVGLGFTVSVGFLETHATQGG